MLRADWLLGLCLHPGPLARWLVGAKQNNNGRIPESFKAADNRVQVCDRMVNVY